MPQGDSASEPERPEADATDALARRFPERAWRIGRLQAEDASFRAICEDYDEARRALAYWLAAGQAGETRQRSIARSSRSSKPRRQLP
jgi:hypothetical protein